MTEQKPEENFDPYEFEKMEIDGVPLYWKNLPWAPCIHVQVIFNTGAFDDPVGLEGLSHFLEHMIFDGSPTLPTKKDITEWSKTYALNTWNAWTSNYNTVYHLECLPENFDTILVGMKDMIFHSLLKPEDVEHERSVITQEAWGRLQNEKFLTYVKGVADVLYHGHEHARFYSPLGWPDTISKFSHADVVKWHAEKYARGNFSIVVAGNMTDTHLEKFSNFVCDIPLQNTESHAEGSIGKPKQNKITKRADEIGEVKEQVEITYMRVLGALPRESHETIFIFRQLLKDILFERLRTERALCYGIRITTWLEKDYSEFGATLLTDEKNIDIVETEFRKAISEIVDGKHIERFNGMKKLGIDQVRSDELVSEDLVARAVRVITRHNGEMKSLKTRLQEMEAVTYADVATLTQKAFDPEYTLTEIILPSKK